MQTDKRAQYLTRDTILKMLSDEEVGRVSTAEASATLAEGDEYLDLERLEDGVRRAQGTSTPTGPVLPKKAVREATWSKILTRLNEPVATARSGGSRGGPS